MALLELNDICKSYKTGDSTTVVLKDLCFSVEKGELVAIMGKSGCGKTTLLNILAGIDYPDSGRYLFDEKGNAYDQNGRRVGRLCLCIESARGLIKIKDTKLFRVGLRDLNPNT